MDKNSVEQFAQEIKEFLSKPCSDWIRSEYNKVIIKKLEELHKLGINDSESMIRIKSGEISGFKSGFEFIETLVKKNSNEGKED